MNYDKIHKTLIEYCRNTTPRHRILLRNKNDRRLKNKIIYIENHHIIPVSLGGVNDLNNLIEVLPEEHLLLHQLRYMVYDTLEDFLAVRVMLNGYKGKIKFNKDILPQTSLLRQ